MRIHQDEIALLHNKEYKEAIAEDFVKLFSSKKEQKIIGSFSPADKIIIDNILIDAKLVNNFKINLSGSGIDCYKVFARKVDITYRYYNFVKRTGSKKKTLTSVGNVGFESLLTDTPYALLLDVTQALQSPSPVVEAEPSECADTVEFKNQILYMLGKIKDSCHAIAKDLSGKKEEEAVSIGIKRWLKKQDFEEFTDEELAELIYDKVSFNMLNQKGFGHENSDNISHKKNLSKILNNIGVLLYDEIAASICFPMFTNSSYNWKIKVGPRFIKESKKPIGE